MKSVMNNRNKIIALVAGFIIFALGMYLFGYKVMARKNQVIADKIAEKNLELEVLLREQKSFEKGKVDLAELEKSDYPPNELFSSDTKVVKEIQQLESAAQRFALDLTINVSGSVKGAKAAPGTSSGLLVVPYTLEVEGPAEGILMFMQAFEKMPFVTQANDVTLTVGNDDLTKATIASEFYIKKP